MMIKIQDIVQISAAFVVLMFLVMIDHPYSLDLGQDFIWRSRKFLGFEVFVLESRYRSLDGVKKNSKITFSRISV